MEVNKGLQDLADDLNARGVTGKAANTIERFLRG
jgi:hypothetical protein